MHLSLSDISFLNNNKVTSSKDYSPNKKLNECNIDEDFFDSEDYFEKSQEKKSKDCNGRFDASEAVKNIGKGMITPFEAIIKRPVMSLGVIGVTIGATALVPVIAPILGVSFGAFSLVQLGKGVHDSIKNYRNKDYDAAEKSFTGIGEGVTGFLMSAFGIKQSAKIVKEARTMSGLNIKSLSKEQKRHTEFVIDNGSYSNALKENISLFTTKKGLKSLVYQFKPSIIKARTSDIAHRVKGNDLILDEREVERIRKKEVKVTEYKEVEKDFEKTSEGIRRAGLTQEQIHKEVKPLYDEVFDKLEVPEELRPELEIIDAKSGGGAYSQVSHKININSTSYVKGESELENVVMHEATHCKKAILRAGIPQERAKQIVKEELINRIMNGESEQVLVDWVIFSITTKPPKMSPKMKLDFVKFAEKELFQPEDPRLTKYVQRCKNSSYSGKERIKAKNEAQPILDKLKGLIKENPEFLNQYKNEEEAITDLAIYARAHNYRYNRFTDLKIGQNIKVPEVTGEDLIKAEQSLREYITTSEGNARISTIDSFYTTSIKEYNQYQFSPEEVFAEQNGDSFLIDKFTSKISEMRKNGSINPVEEYRLNKAVNRARAEIEYKTKGLNYYKQYTEMINNPEDKILAQTVKNMEK